MGIKSGSVQSVRISSTGENYFNEHTFSGDGSELIYTQKTFGFPAEYLCITNDSETKEVSISYDAATLNGKLAARESKSFYPSQRGSVYIKAESGSTDKVRIWAS